MTNREPRTLSEQERVLASLRKELAMMGKLKKSSPKVPDKYVDTILIPAHESNHVQRLLAGRSGGHMQTRSLEFLKVDQSPNGAVTYVAECLRCSGAGLIAVHTTLDKHGNCIWPPLRGIPQLCEGCEDRLDSEFSRAPRAINIMVPAKAKAGHSDDPKLN